MSCKPIGKPTLVALTREGTGFLARPPHVAVLCLVLGIAAAARAAEVPLRHVIIDASGPKNPWAKMLGDIDGNGSLDVIIGGQNGPLVWYAHPAWTKTTIATGGYNTVDGEVGDVDGDGDLDVVMGGVIWYENPRPENKPTRPVWKAHRIGTHRTHDLELGDLDGDGDLDVVTRDQSGFGHKTGNTIHLWRQNSPTSWSCRILSCPHGEGVSLGDIDNDGDLDVIIGGRWYENTKDSMKGTWKEHRFCSWHEDAVVKMGDINADGRPDVVLTRSEGPYKVSWFEAPADPRRESWAEHIIDKSLDYAHGIELADMDGDGDLDVVTAEMHQSRRDRILVYLNRDKGLRWTPQVVATTGLHNLRVGDVGNDGDLDIVGANWSGNYQPIEIWENQRKR